MSVTDQDNSRDYFTHIADVIQNDPYSLRFAKYIMDSSKRMSITISVKNGFINPENFKLVS